MALFDRRTASVLTTILAFAGLLALVWLARLPIIAFIFAVFFAHLLQPVVGRFQGWLRLSRGKSVAITYLAIFGGLAIFGVTVGPRIVDQGQRLSRTLPSLFRRNGLCSQRWWRLVLVFLLHNLKRCGRARAAPQSIQRQ